MTFSVVYADPPWAFQNTRTGGSHTSGSAQKYPTMKLSSIQQLPVRSITAANGAMFLWVPSRLKFSHGASTLAAWGCTYQATIYWDKQRLGMGFWFRGQVEELLVATWGDVAPFRCQLPNILHQRAGKHSAKPDDFRRIIEKATEGLGGRRVELFARQRAPGWTCLGNMVTGNDIYQDLRVQVGV